MRRTPRLVLVAALGCVADRAEVPRLPLLFRNFHSRLESGMVSQVRMHL